MRYPNPARCCEWTAIDCPKIRLSIDFLLLHALQKCCRREFRSDSFVLESIPGFGGRGLDPVTEIG